MSSLQDLLSLTVLPPMPSLTFNFSLSETAQLETLRPKVRHVLMAPGVPLGGIRTVGLVIQLPASRASLRLKNDGTITPHTDISTRAWALVWNLYPQTSQQYTLKMTS